MVAYLEGKPQVQARQVEIAIKEIMQNEQAEQQPKVKKSGLLWRMLLLLSALALAGGMAWLILNGKLHSP